MIINFDLAINCENFDAQRWSEIRAIYEQQRTRYDDDTHRI